LLDEDPLDLELLVPSRVLAASLLVGPDESAVRVLLGDESDPGIGVAAERYRDNGIWRGGAVCVDDLGELEGDGQAAVIMWTMLVMCGAGLLVRCESAEAPAVSPAPPERAAVRALPPFLA